MPSPSPGPVFDPDPEPKQEEDEGSSRGLRRSERIQRLTSVARTSDWNESTAAIADFFFVETVHHIAPIPVPPDWPTEKLDGSRR
ncbi:BQ5605_C025g10105 [Microbotryum silenes-dioicae]|uniref:BQ5605_C025g10091 protein n=1 Tax=Microbotryum silenes-dioicae TaxID=796604 RepID=A0A2X0PMQ2_9BASI|nr:BQ5605_C025g10091 [Microbotryum silenes-dioicae]SGZ27284.1 BQ5605_C025g10105 [Microbotryum silenes-dioicae]